VKKWPSERQRFEAFMKRDFSYLSLQRDADQPEGYADERVDLMFTAWTESLTTFQMI
jgi:hypothetical protein